MPFLRATFYRWAQLWPELCADLTDAPEILAVGDLHVENFGTWRDSEGRLVWGVNDFDEAWRLPYTNDLVRLVASVILAVEVDSLRHDASDAAATILTGYRDALAAGGRPIVLAERHPALHRMAVHRLKDPEHFWEKLQDCDTVRGPVPSGALKALAKLWPEKDLPWRVVHRIAGVGGLGRRRFVALAEWRGGLIAREAKDLTVSACQWATPGGDGSKVFYRSILEQAVRCRDPLVAVRKHWVVRRLAPDCSRIDLASLPAERDERHLLHAMGWETGNVHVGSGEARRILIDLAKRPKDWLVQAADVMATAAKRGWAEWRRGRQ